MEEKILNLKQNGMMMLIVDILLWIVPVGLVIMAESMFGTMALVLSIVVMVICYIAAILILPGLKVLKPQEALVLTLFGKYVGTLKSEGFYFVYPFVTAVNPAAGTKLNQSGDIEASNSKVKVNSSSEVLSKKISLKMMTLSNTKQKINDCLGNPIEIGIAVIWRVKDTAKAVFNVDNYKEYLSLQCDAALRNIVRLYPYDVSSNVDTTGDGEFDDGSLRGSSEVVAQRIKQEIQDKVAEAGLEIVEARITYLAYAPEIAAVSTRFSPVQITAMARPSCDGIKNRRIPFSGIQRL